MKLFKESSCSEYIKWYLEREFKKYNRENDNPFRFANEEEMIQYMETNHSGKLRPWFKDGIWSIQILTFDELNNLVCLEGEWTKQYLIPESHREEKNYRILKQMVINAKELDYFTKTDNELQKLGDKPDNRYKYFNKFKDQEEKILPSLTASDRIVLCSLSNDEKNSNPLGNFYLHDGFGRLLTYQYLITYHKYKLNGDLEAFIVENK